MESDNIISPKEAKEVLDFCVDQYKGMANVLPSDVFPRSIDSEGNIVYCDSDWWTSGFFPGSLWYLYEYSGDTSILKAAKHWTELIEEEKYNTTIHDLGFMLYCSFGNGLRITGEDSYKDILITGANSLSSRYNPKVGCIKSWDHLSKFDFPVIIDNMMNLEYLFWASKTTGDQKFYQEAVSHANNTIKNHFREDYSSYHVVDYNSTTREVISKVTHQGYSDESAWARGQAWGLYGFTMAFRETGDSVYLEQANHIADFILNHPDLPDDMIPYWDFNAPDIPNALRDASSAAIIASGLLELQKYNDAERKDTYIKASEKILHSLMSDKYLAKPGENGHFILKHSVGHKPANSEVDVPLSYADYYFIEALIRFLACAK